MLNNKETQIEPSNFLIPHLSKLKVQTFDISNRDYLILQHLQFDIL